MKVWQIATGMTSRDYRDLFFDHDVMIIGPSQYGSALETDYSGGSGTAIGNQIDSFAHDPLPGDRVVMRFSRSIIGVGQIPSGDHSQYSFDEAYRTIYGWDLRHCRRVKWGPRGRLGALRKVTFAARQQPTFTRVHEPDIVRLVEHLPSSWFHRPLKKRPYHDAALYSEEELEADLFTAGISSKNIHDIYAALRQAGNLCTWYWNQQGGERPTEHEVVSHMVLPLFLGLGWSHQQMAVEWNRIDVAFFKGTPTKEQNCIMVLEAKGIYEGLGDVLDQPIRYVRDLGLTRTRYIVVTNGQILLVYGKTRGSWNQTPIAFLDVSCLQKQYALPRRTNPVKVLVMLQPSAV